MHVRQACGRTMSEAGGGGGGGGGGALDAGGGAGGRRRSCSWRAVSRPAEALHMTTGTPSAGWAHAECCHKTGLMEGVAASL